MLPTERTSLLKIRFDDTESSSKLLCNRKGVFIYLGVLHVSCAVLMYLITRVFELALAAVAWIFMAMVRFRATSIVLTYIRD
jgi:uncharacterized membrane protein YjgN (DUF898 family)